MEHETPQANQPSGFDPDLGRLTDEMFRLFGQIDAFQRALKRVTDKAMPDYLAAARQAHQTQPEAHDV